MENKIDAGPVAPPTPWTVHSFAGGWLVIDANGGAITGPINEHAARLLTAAPELRDAAQRIIDAIGEDLPCECAKDGNPDAIYEPGETCPPCGLRAAIEKAGAPYGE